MTLFAKNLLSLSVADILSKLLNFFALLYLGRHLGPGGFGQVNFALAILAYFTMMTDLNLTTVGIRDVAKSRDVAAYASSFVTLRLILGVLAFGLLLIFVAVFPLPRGAARLIVLFSLSVLPTVLLLEWFFNGLERMGYLGASRVIRAATFLGLILLATATSRLTPGVVALVYVASGVSSVIAQTYWLRKNGWALRVRVDLDHWRLLVRDTAPLALSVITAQIFANLDTVLLGFMTNDQVVGWYSAGNRIIATVLGSAAVFVNTLYPILARHSDSPDDLRRLIFSSSRLLLFVSLPVAVGGTVLAVPMLTALYGAEYAHGAAAFQILVWRVLVVYATFPLSYGLLACNRGREYFVSVAVAAVLNPILNVILIKQYSLIGAAIAMLVTECVVLVMCVVFTRRMVSVPWRDIFPKPFLASVLMGTAVALIPVHVFLRIAAGIVFYLSIVLGLKWVTKEDLHRLR